jgi:hypothetical protein
MALSLEQVNNNKKKNLQANIEIKDKANRPWETKTNNIQSFSGNNAAKKAREIVEKNNQLVDEIRSLKVSQESVNEVESYIQEREKQFEELTESAVDVQKIKTHRGFLGRIKKAVLGH